MAKSVLITGGAKRLGQEMALSLAEKGWAIALHYRNSLEEAESTREKIEEAGSDCKLFSADLENPRIRGNDEAGSLGIPGSRPAGPQCFCF